MVIEIFENEFDEKIKDPCIVDFYTSTCPSCVMLAPVFEKVSEDFAGEISFYKINLENAMSLAQRFSIMYVPTLIVFKDGSAAAAETGFMDEAALSEFVKNA